MSRLRLLRGVLAALLVGLALQQSVSALRVLQLPAALAAQVGLLPPLEFVAGGAWLLLAAAAALGLAVQRRHAVRYAAIVFGSFTLYTLLRLMLFARADYDRQRLPFALLAALAVLGVLVVLVLWAERAHLDQE